PSGAIRGITFAHQPTNGQHPVWYSGSRLAPDLSLPKILNRLTTAHHLTTTYHPHDPWRHAARHLDTLPTTLNQADEQTATDHIHAFGTLLDAATQTAPAPGRAHLRQAAAAFERATHTRRQADYQAGHALRELADHLTRTPASGDTTARLLCTAIVAVIAIARWHHARRHQQQEAAARQALTHLRTAYQHAAAAPLADIAAQAQDPRIAAHWETRIHALLPETANRITTSPVWHALATTLHQVHLTGIRTDALLTAEQTRSELTDADDPTALLLWRLRDQLAQQHQRHQAMNTAPHAIQETVPPRTATAPKEPEAARSGNR
ncbi:mobilization protein, partial [Streptomyces sp. 4N509B]